MSARLMGTPIWAVKSMIVVYPPIQQISDSVGAPSTKELRPYTGLTVLRQKVIMSEDANFSWAGSMDGYDIIMVVVGGVYMAMAAICKRVTTSNTIVVIGW